MNTHSDKTQENKNQVVFNDKTQKSTGGTSTFQFVDNRTETIVQRKLQNLANNSLHTILPAQLKSNTGNSSENVVQKQGLEEDELLQGKFITLQKQGIEEEELLQGKFNPVQKKDHEEEELLQGKFDPIQKKASPESSRKENNTGLPDNLKSGIENLSGYSLDDVKVNLNSNKPAQLNAHAYAQGSEIHVAPGQEKHLPHEAWHVVQQKQGRVKPTMQMKGNINVNDDAGLEKEADVVGAKALQRKLKENESSTETNSSSKKKNNIKKGFGNKHVASVTQKKSLLTMNTTTNVKQLKGDKYYWVRPNGGTWTYVGAFKNHAEANEWWAANKSSYPDGSFGQGSTKTKYK